MHTNGIFRTGCYALYSQSRGRNGMRYALLVGAWISELLFFSAVALVAHSTITGSIGLLVGVLFIYLGFRAWKSVGGFDPWRPSKIRQHLQSLKEAGL